MSTEESAVATESAVPTMPGNASSSQNLPERGRQVFESIAEAEEGMEDWTLEGNTKPSEFQLRPTAPEFIPLPTKLRNKE